MKRIGINYKPLRLALSHRNTVSRLLFLTLFLFSFIGGATSQTTFTKDIAGYGDGEGHWYLIASPVIEDVQPTEANGFLTNDYDLYEFDQSKDGEEWLNYKPNNFNLFPGKGYLYANSEDVTLTFTGTPYNGDGIIELKKSDGAHFEGWNLIGNPFSVEAIIDHDFYVMNADGTEIIAAESGNTVGPMEGIFVVASDEGETVTFTPIDDVNGARSASLALNLSRGSASPGSTRGTIDRVIVRFGEGRMLPKFQLNPNHTKVYIPMDGKDYAVVRSKGVYEMPVNFKADANGSYTLSVSTEEVSFGYLHLIDSKTGNDIDLLETPSYTFEASTTDDASRFKLVYAQDGNTKPNTTADVKRSPTRGMDNVPILPGHHGEEGNQPAWEDDNGGDDGGDDEWGDDPQSTTAVLTIQLSEGWNWFSTNVEISLDDLKNALIETLPGANGITIYSMSNQSITYNSAISRWRGTLPSLDVAQMYMIKTPADCEITLEGPPIDPADHPVTINRGDNRIAFPLNMPMTVAEAFTGFAVSGDIISSQTAFAVYTENGWRGTLRSLEPGQGYYYKSADDEERVLKFPPSNYARRVSRSRSIQYGTHWSFDFHAYQFNQPVVATIQIGGSTIASDDNWEDLEIAAFVGDECRGSALMRYEFVDEIPVVELPVYYNYSGEEVTFKLYDHAYGIEYDVCTPNKVIHTGEEHVDFYMGDEESVILNFSLNSVELELADDDSTMPDGEKNDDLIDDYAGETVNITLQGRTLYKDGAWNTLCLPFGVTATQMAETTHPLYGATIKELDATGTYSDHQTGLAPDGTLYLYFKNATSIEAGRPYIVKWASGDDLVNPVFSDVTIDNSAPTDVTLSDGKYIVEAKNSGYYTVQFIGSYSPVALTPDDMSNLFLGTSTDDQKKSTLYYPSAANNNDGNYYVNACRAYFHVDLTGDVNAVRAFNLNFGDEDEMTGITTTDSTDFTDKAGAWFDLSGRKLNGKPAKKGVYINNGKKVIVK